MTILIIIVAIVGALVGYYQGALKQLAIMGGVILGLVLAVVAYHQFGTFLADTTGTELSTAEIVAFVLIVIIIPLVLGIGAAFLTQAFKAVHLNCINRLLGALIGAVSPLLLLSVAFNVYDFLKSNAGLMTEQLEERSPVYYQLKQMPQPLLPDLLIVTDSTEEANGAEIRRPYQEYLNDNL